MSDANAKQVGGDHYKTSYQHWDMLVNLGFNSDYFIGQFTKYITRWRKKHGIRDLRKGLHFLDKLIELCSTHDDASILRHGNISEERIQELIMVNKDHLFKYYRENEVGPDEAASCTLVLFAPDSNALHNARMLIDNLIVQTLNAGGLEAASDADRPVSSKFTFMEYSDEGNAMVWKCKTCSEVIELDSDQPPALYHKHDV